MADGKINGAKFKEKQTVFIISNISLKTLDNCKAGEIVDL
jgi:hypothetical protein